MKKIDVEEVKTIELDILDEVDSFCEKNNIRYYLCAGTLIGAIRHKGFIPWDDDIDIIMPRPDYMKFIELFNKSSLYRRVKSPHNSNLCYTTFATVEDTRTIKKYNLFYKSIDEGISIDVFPIDGSPENTLQRKLFWKINNFMAIISILASQKISVSNHYCDQDVKFAKLRGLIRTIIKCTGIPFARILNKIFNFHFLVNKLAMKYDVDKSTYIGVSTFPHYGYRECILGEKFLEMVKRPFEGKLYNTPYYYEEYLHNLYGDYMKLPPKDKQVSHHDVDCYWK